MGPVKAYRLNNQIQYPSVRLLAEDGSQIGVLGIAQARKKSAETGLDLVEISPSATPPVVKLINFKKFRYQEAKKEREALKKVKKVDLKEVRLSPFMGENDFLVKIGRAREFLLGGNKVRLVVKFTGRQLSRQEFGFSVIKKAFDQLADVSAVDMEPKMLGRQIISVVRPSKK